MNDKKYICNYSIPAICFLFFIFAPVELYLMIKQDTWISLGDFVLYLLAFFVCSLLAGLLIDALMQRLCPKIWNKAVLLFFAIFIAIYIQGNFLNADYGVLNGKPIDWSQYPYEGIKSVILFAIMIAVSIFVSIKFPADKIKRVENIIAV